MDPDPTNNPMTDQDLDPTYALQIDEEDIKIWQNLYLWTYMGIFVYHGVL